ncbi:hypothetical protein HDE_04492 [Halotydeus destructor]|nr:hypothetical protein HDE_04492 [Halotydeus destructor]
MAEIPDGEVLRHIGKRYETGVSHFHNPLSSRLIFGQVDPFGRFPEVMPIPRLKKLIKAHVTYAEDHNFASSIMVYDLEPFLHSCLSTQFESITVTRAVLESATVNNHQQGPIIHMNVSAKDRHQLGTMHPFVWLQIDADDTH